MLGAQIKMAADLAASYIVDFIVFLAPQVGLEPTTLRLTAECSTIELLRSGLAVAFAITADTLRRCQMLCGARGPGALDSSKSPVIGSWGLAASEPAFWRPQP